MFASLRKKFKHCIVMEFQEGRDDTILELTVDLVRPIGPTNPPSNSIELDSINRTMLSRT